MKKTILGIVLILAVSVFGQTLHGNLVLPPGAFLWLTTDAATEALGGAATAANDPISSGWANPSCLFYSGAFSAGASYCYIREKTLHSEIYATKRYKDWAGAARFFLVDSKDIEARTAPTSEPDYTFDSHQLYIQLTGARRIVNIANLGVSAKWVHERIDQDNRDGWIFDFGASGEYRFIRAGIAVKNWGNKEMVFRLYRENYPITYRTGIQAEILDYAVIRADWVKPDKLDGWLPLGAEGYIGDYVVLRAGWTAFHDTRNISGGIGVRFRGLRLDYAVVNYSENLGMSHQVTLSYVPVTR